LARRLASNGSIDKPATAGDSFGTVIAFLPGVVMPRRVLALVAILGTLAVIACQGAPAAPPISDPKEILAKTVLSLKDVKTVDVRGELTGTALVGGTGTLDLKGTTIDLAADIPAKKAKLSLSAPSLLGTSADAIVLDTIAYYKIAGPFAAMIGADPTGKYTRTDLPEASGEPGGIASDPLKAIEELRAQLDKLPTAPTKLANESCGNQDCYHVFLTLTDQDLAAMDPLATPSSTPFTLNVDIFSRTNDLRPARLVMAVEAAPVGTVTLTFNLTYDRSVSIEAPSADQIVGL